MLEIDGHSPILSIVIVTFNPEEYIYWCLKSLAKSQIKYPFEVIIVDNSEKESYREYIKRLTKSEELKKLQIFLHFNNANLGFGKACNIGASISRGKYILFLNPDTIVAEDTIEEIVNFAEATKNVHALGVCMINKIGKILPESKRGRPTFTRAIIKSLGLTPLFEYSSKMGGYYMNFVDLKEPHPIEVLSGAFLFIQKKVFDEVGGFSPSFFMYAEDIDISLRLIKKGYTSYFIPNLFILHYKGSATEKRWALKLIYFYDAITRFIIKHYPAYIALLIIPFVFLKLILHFLFVFTKKIITTLFKFAIKFFPKNEYGFESIVISSNSKYAPPSSLNSNNLWLNPSNGKKEIEKLPLLIVDWRPKKIVIEEDALSFEEVIKYAKEAYEYCKVVRVSPPEWLFVKKYS